ncbi:MAG: hypothetical protein GTO40_10035, partial [Deltaproteobacteria bacterium]|nr:hypothetical protein [Deltaproteobacteria bacterium]
NILGDLGWLEYDHTIAGMINFLGIIFIILSFCWGAYLLFLQYKNLTGWDE